MPLLRFSQPIIQAFKTVDQSVNNSTTLVNVTALTINLLPNTTYVIDGSFLVNSSTVADFKATFTVIANSILAVFWLGDGSTNTEDFGTNIIGVGSGTNRGDIIGGLITMGTTSGTLQVEFAQNVAEVSNTTVLAGSWIRATEVV